MAPSTNPYTFSIKDVKVKRSSTTVTLPAAQELSVTAMIVSGMLRGSGKIVAANSYIEGAELAFGVGGIPIALFPVIFGFALPAATGTSPNQVREIDIPASSALPYFEVMGRSEDGEGGDVHIYIPKAKIMSGFQVQMQDGANFAAPKMTATCLPDDDGMPFRFIVNETTTAIAFPA